MITFGMFLLSLVAFNVATDGSIKNIVDAEVMPHVESLASASVNEETGLTDFNVLGKEFSLSVENRYDLND